MSQVAHLLPCSPQKPVAPEAQPKSVGIGLPAKPVLLRPTPQPSVPAPLTNAPKPPTKPVASPILAQDRTSPETSECLTTLGTSQTGLGGQHSPNLYLPLTPDSQPQPARNWFGTQHSTRSTSHSPRSRSETLSGSTSSQPGEAALRPSGGQRPIPRPTVGTATSLCQSVILHAA